MYTDLSFGSRGVPRLKKRAAGELQHWKHTAPVIPVHSHWRTFILHQHVGEIRQDRVSPVCKLLHRVCDDFHGIEVNVGKAG